MNVKSESEVTQSCLTLSDPMDCSLPGSSVHGIVQARVLEWVAIAFSNICLKSFALCPKGYSIFYMPKIYEGESNGNPLQYSCLENPMDGGAWWAAVPGVTKSQT